MTSYSPYNGYSNQLQYYHPYNYASYYSTPYGTMTDASFQNGYYAVDGVKDSSGANSGVKIFFTVLKYGLKIANIVLGGGGGGFGSTMITGGFAPTTIM